MEKSTDNINRKYAVYMRHPGSMQRALSNIAKNSKHMYDTFKEVAEKHSDIGHAVVPIMSNNYAAHLVKVASDESIPLRERIYSVAALISPMYSLMYDRLTQEEIERTLSELSRDS